MDTKQLRLNVQQFIKNGGYPNSFPSVLNYMSEKVATMSDSEIAELEQVYFDLRYWIRNNTGHIWLKDALRKLELSLKSDGRAKYITGSMSIGALDDGSRDTNIFSLRSL